MDFWDWTSDPSGEQAYLTSFLQSVGGTAWLYTVFQYGGGWTGDLLAGTWSDSTAVPANPTDAQIQAEAAAAASHFGIGTSDNVQIVVATPTGHSTGWFRLEFLCLPRSHQRPPERDLHGLAVYDRRRRQLREGLGQRIRRPA